MNLAENKYHSTIKVEFKDLVSNFVHSGREKFHVYTIHRLLSLGLLIDFQFDYTAMDDPDQIGIKLDLKEHGTVLFDIGVSSGYGSIANSEGMQVLHHFLENFDTCLDNKQKRRKLR